MKNWLLAAAFAAGLSDAAGAENLMQIAEPMLTLSFTSTSQSSELRAQVQHLAGPRFAISMANAPGGTPVWVASGHLDAQGSGTAHFTAPPPSAFEINELLYFRATFFGLNGREHTDWIPLGINPNCERLNFNYDQTGNQIVAGTPILGQWLGAGVAVSAVSNGSGPDQAIIFDSSNPSGGDPDLQTPGYGIDNTTAQGNLLIIAENVIDANADGFVDVPDDAAAGGVIVFDFTRPVAACSIGLIDLDEGGIGSVIRFFTGATEIGEIALPAIGDNSFQQVNFFLQNVTRIEVFFAGSGGVPFLGLIACPTVVDFDRNSFGEPLALLPPGTVFINQLFESLSMSGSAQNDTPGHPDELVVFDTANPTGGDTDLVTPGYGFGNNAALGKVLVIAENDVDSNGDGLVDDPDDEAFGGAIVLDFIDDITFERAVVLDVDSNESSFLLFRDQFGNVITTIPLVPLGDNSQQEVLQEVPGVRKIELHLGGSGALAQLRYCPRVASGTGGV